MTTTGQTDPAGDAAKILLPAQTPRGFAIYAVRPVDAHGQAASAIPSALAARGIAVLALDLASSSPPPTDTTSVDERDAAAVRRAAQTLQAHHQAPALLVGHSAAGPAVLAAAASLTNVRAVVTVSSPAPRSGPPTRVPLLVLHAPRDPIVSAREASRVFAAARHPKSFIALDGIDHPPANRSRPGR
jgi:putative redox protein